MSGIGKHRRVHGLRAIMAIGAAVALGHWAPAQALPTTAAPGAEEGPVGPSLTFTPGPSSKDPHPVVYAFGGKYEPVTEPGPYYYSFFYTGTVTADARVDASEKVARLALPKPQFDAAYETMVGQLEQFYKTAANIPEDVAPTFVPTGEQVVVQRGADGTPVNAATGAAVANANAEAQVGLQTPTGPSFTYNSARSAAEWTFYYDQVVLWEYYCSRSILSQKDADFESMGTGAKGPGTGAGPGGAQATRAGGNPRSVALGGPQAAPGAPGQNGAAALRKTFTPDADYLSEIRPNMQEAAMGERDAFQKLADDREKLIYKTYKDMLQRIDMREVNQENYDFWIENKRKAIDKFAEEWRKVEDGDIMFLDNSLYLVTKQPLTSGPLEATNVVVKEQLTPQDLIKPDGTMIKSQSY